MVEQIKMENQAICIAVFFDEGKFLYPAILAIEMQEFVKDKLKEMNGFMKFFYRHFFKRN